MMRMKTGTTGLSPTNGGGGGIVGGEWEMRPGGMLVQKRTDSDQNRIPPPTIRIRVKYGSTHHELNISSQATFGELKKMLSGPTGLHHQDQKLLFNNKERDSKTFLDVVGVKDRSKIVLVEDPISQEKRYIEMRKNAKMEKASKSISQISLEIDRLAGQVSALELVISKGGKVAEKDVLKLTEMLMNELLKLDGIVADGDAKLQRKMQVRRVQKYVETLDMLKIKNSTPTSNGSQIQQQHQQQRYSNGQTPLPNQQQQPRPSIGHYPNGQISSPNQQQQPRHSIGHYPNGQISSPNQQQQPRHSIGHYPNGQILSPNQQQHQRHSIGHLPMHVLPRPQPQPQQPPRHSMSGPVVITTQWETFDPTPAMAPTTASTTTANSLHHPKFNWDLL